MFCLSFNLYLKVYYEDASLCKIFSVDLNQYKPNSTTVLLFVKTSDNNHQTIKNVTISSYCFDGIFPVYIAEGASLWNYEKFIIKNMLWRRIYICKIFYVTIIGLNQL